MIPRLCHTSSFGKLIFVIIFLGVEILGHLFYTYLALYQITFTRAKKWVQELQSQGITSVYLISLALLKCYLMYREGSLYWTQMFLSGQDCDKFISLYISMLDLAVDLKFVILMYLWIKNECETTALRWSLNYVWWEAK